MKKKKVNSWIMTFKLVITQLQKRVHSFEQRLALLEARPNALTMKVEELEKRLLGVGGIEQRLAAVEAQKPAPEKDWVCSRCGKTFKDGVAHFCWTTTNTDAHKLAQDWLCDKPLPAPMTLTAEQVMVLKDLRDRLMGVTNPNPVTAEVLEVLDDILKA